MLKFWLAVAATASLTTTPARAAPAVTSVTVPSPGPVTPARQALADQLVLVTQPDDLMIQSVLLGWEKGMENEKDSMAELDKISPGLSAELAARGKVEMVAMVKEALPAFRADLAKIYAAGASETELKTILDYYRSSGGQKIIHNVIMSTDVPGADEGKVSASELTKANVKTAISALGEMTAEEKVALMRLGMSPAGKRMREMGPKVQQTSADWLNRLLEKLPERLAPVIDKLVTERLKAK